MTTGLAVAAAAVAFAGCGQSAADKAKNQVCDARADIQKQVSTLKSITPATFSANTVKDSVTAIKNDITKIADAQPKLNEQRKQDVKSANDAFKSQVEGIITGLTTNLSVTTAQQQLQSALTQLGNAYKKSLSKINCG